MKSLWEELLQYDWSHDYGALFFGSAFLGLVIVSIPILWNEFRNKK